MKIKEGDYVYIEGEYGDVISVSQPFKYGNITLEDGSHPYGREVTIFIEGDE